MPRSVLAEAPGKTDYGFDEDEMERVMEPAFAVLGIEPTGDDAAVRAAYVRLARIYHPDRYVDQPDDVRTEAERRMKEVSWAYELIRRRLNGEAAPAPSYSEILERARASREAARVRREEEAVRLERWRRWERLEAQARQRAEIEASLSDIDIELPVEVSTDAARPPRPQSQLVLRLQAAYAAEKTLVPCSDEAEAS